MNIRLFFFTLIILKVLSLPLYSSNNNVGCKVSATEGSSVPLSLIIALRNEIQKHGLLDINQHRKKFDNNVNIQLDFPVKTFQHYALVVGIKVNEQVKKDLVLIPRQDLENVIKESCEQIIKSVLIETNIIDGVHLNKDLAKNIKYIDKKKDLLRIDVLEKGKNPHEYSRLNKLNKNKTLKKEHEVSDKSNIHYNYRSKSLFQRLLAISHEQSIKHNSYPKVNSSGLTSLLPQIGLEEYWVNPDKEINLQFHTSYTDEDFSYQFGDYDLQSKGEYTQAKLLISKRISNYTLGFTMNSGLRKSKYTLTSRTAPVRNIYDNFDFALGDVSLYADVQLPPSILPLTTSLIVKLPTGSKKDLMSVDSTDVTFGINTSFYHFDYQLNYTIVGTTDFLNLQQDSGVDNYMSFAMGKSFKWLRLPSSQLSVALYVSENPLEHLIQIENVNQLIISAGTKYTREFKNSHYNIEASVGLTDTAPNFSIGFSVDY